MNGECLTVQEGEDGLLLDQRVPCADAGLLLRTSAAFPSPPADLGCWTSQNEASILPTSSVSRITIPLPLNVRQDVFLALTNLGERKRRKILTPGLRGHIKWINGPP